MSQRIFISYSRTDAAFAKQLAADLKHFGADIWIDTEEIHAGVKWSTAIQEGLKNSHLMILIHSPMAAASENVEEEWQYFKDKKKPIIPILLLPTEIHFQLNRLQWVDFHALGYDAAFEKLRDELSLKGVTLGTGPVVSAPPPVLKKSALPRPKFTLPLLEWIKIPAGKVTLEKGFDEQHRYSKEHMGTHVVAPFAIAKYPVTNAQFQQFIDDGGYREDRYWKDIVKRETSPSAPKWNDPTCPRESVSLYEAVAFIKWLREKTGLAITLPTEMQWQWAAVGDKRWIYPYGNTFDENKSNTIESGINRTTPVDRYPQGASPFGVMDMSGNIFEWTLTADKTFEDESRAYKEVRTVRGGCWDYHRVDARVMARNNNEPEGRDIRIGFRLALILPASS